MRGERLNWIQQSTNQMHSVLENGYVKSIASAFTGITSGLDFHIHNWINKGMYPSFLVFEVTQKCNSRCKMCNLWKKSPENELNLSEISELFSDSFFKSVKWINLTGGEPFLRDDFEDIVEVIIDKFPKLKTISIATNGYLTNKIERTIKRVLNELDAETFISITISIDGLKETHDEIRGVLKAFDRAIMTLESLSKFDYKNFSAGAQITVSKLNASELSQTYELLRRYTDHINITPAMISDSYFENKDNEMQLLMNEREKREFFSFLKRVSIEEPEHAYYYSKIADSYRSYPCLAFYKSIYLDSTGNVYPCQYLPDFLLGNNHEMKIQDIWFSDDANKRRRELKKCAYCKTCFNNCDIICTMKDEFIDFLFFILSNPKIGLSLAKKVDKGYGKGFL